MTAAARLALSHLDAALLQVVASDDAILVGHMRAAAEALRGVGAPWLDSLDVARDLVIREAWTLGQALDEAAAMAGCDLSAHLAVSLHCLDRDARGLVAVRAIEAAIEALSTTTEREAAV